MRRSVVCAIVGLLFLPSCGRPIMLRPLPADHPANPEAPESPVQAPSKTLGEGASVMSNDAGAPTPQHPAHPDHQLEAGNGKKHAAAEPQSSPAKLYRCPMHPKVKASTPGPCPKCGMALKKKEPSK